MKDSSTHNFSEHLTDEVPKSEDINYLAKREDNSNQFFSEHEATYRNDLETTPLWVTRQNRNGFC